jgi:hypothetical protein
VTEVHGVEVDVCPDCHGVALDAGELELLQKHAREDREAEFDLKPRLGPETLAEPRCAACKRSLQPRHAFTLDNQLYCGSCAPEGSAPYDTTLTRAIPTMATSAGLGRRAWEVDPLTAAVNWLFSKLKD